MEDIVTIDGPTSSGKNSVGFLLAKKLGYQYIDTGMIYRIGCLNILRNKIFLNEKEKILEIFRNLNVEFKTEDGIWKVYSEGEDLTDILHTPEISKLVSKVAATAEVREIMRNIQHKIGESGKIVMGGRDIGSEIYPKAKYKFFLTATPEVRAQRRFKQLVMKDPEIKYEDVLSDMQSRDNQDMTREASPLRTPQGGVTIDNSNFSIEQTVDEMLKVISTKNA